MEPLCQLEVSDGYGLAYRRWPAVGTPRARVVLLNGIMSNSAWFSPVAPALCEAGFELVGADRRGSGPNKGGWGDAPSAGRLVDDVLEVIAAQTPADLPLILVGWCWGAALAINAAAKRPPTLRGVVLVTPGMHNTTALQDAVQAQRAAIEAGPPDAPVVRSPVREEWFTRGEALEAFIRQDRDRVLMMTPRMLDVTRKLATGAGARVSRLEAPLLLLLAEHDEATDNAATLAAFGKVPASQLSTAVLPTRHGVQFDAPDALVRAIRAFADPLL